MISLPATGEKVAVLGTAPSTRHLAPFDDETWEIWACSPAVDRNARITRFFEIHELERERQERPDYFAWLQNAHFPIYTFEDAADLPSLVRYPRDEVIGEYGPEFLSSSIAWMLALALRCAEANEGLKEVAIYGVDMCSDDEYDHQKPGCWFFTKMLERQGVKVHIPAISDLHCHLPPYPGRSELTRRVRQRIKETEQELHRVTSNMAALRRSLDDLTGQKVFYEGRLAELEYWKQNWSAQWEEV